MTVGIFDSGIGGLTVAKSLIDAKIFENVIYYGDTARVPYGTKDENTIVRYSLEAVEFFKNFNIDILIVACNTVSSYALKEMSKIAPFEVVGVIEPGVMSIIKKKPEKKSSVLVIGTRATVSSGAYQNILSKFGIGNIRAIETGMFVPLVEEGITEGPVMDALMEHYFKGESEPDFIILGCTHFPLISKAIQSYFPSAVLVHSGEAIVEYLEQKYSISADKKTPEVKLFASSSPDRLKERAKEWLAGSEYNG